MHTTAMSNSQSFFNAYASAFSSQKNVRVVEIGSQDVNGSLRATAPSNFDYLGIDFVEGKGVDLVINDPYEIPLEDQSVDIVLSSSCFEHSEMFWIVFLEVMRILKPKGLFYLNAPSNGDYHRYPVDCWRFYPDSGKALVSWAKRNSINAVLLESYISFQINEGWNDFVAVFAKDENHINDFQDRILRTKNDVNNGIIFGSDEIINESSMPEDKRKLMAISKITSNELKIIY